MEFNKVLIIGAGQMGSGIAQVMAQSGLTVIIRDIKDEFVQKGIASIEKNINRSIEKGKMTEQEKAATMGRISGIVELNAETCDVDLVVEAASENIAIKREVFQTLDKMCPAKTIFASNTSSVSITTLAAMTSRPDKFIGMHFFNPAPVIKLI